MTIRIHQKVTEIFFCRNMIPNLSYCGEVLSMPPVTDRHGTPSLPDRKDPCASLTDVQEYLVCFYSHSYK